MLGTIETVQDSGVILISPDDRDAGRRSFDDAIWRVLAWIVLAAPGALAANDWIGDRSWHAGAVTSAIVGCGLVAAAARAWEVMVDAIPPSTRIREIAWRDGTIRATVVNGDELRSTTVGCDEVRDLVLAEGTTEIGSRFAGEVSFDTPTGIDTWCLIGPGAPQAVAVVSSLTGVPVRPEMYQRVARPGAGLGAREGWSTALVGPLRALAVCALCCALSGLAVGAAIAWV